MYSTGALRVLIMSITFEVGAIRDYFNKTFLGSPLPVVADPENLSWGDMYNINEILKN